MPILNSSATCPLPNDSSEKLERAKALLRNLHGEDKALTFETCAKIMVQFAEIEEGGKR